MTIKHWSGLVLGIILAFVYVRNFTTWFRRPQIEITVTSRPGRPGVAPADAAPIVFGLDRDYELRSVEVLSLSSLQTSSVPVAVWRVESKKGKSTPLRGFPYGDTLEGLAPSPKLPEPQPLVPGLPYRIEVTSTRSHGQQDFTPAAVGE